MSLVTRTRRHRARAVAVLVGVVLVVGGCSGTEQPTTTATPSGFEPPAGVTLTDPGVTLEVGEPGTVPLELGDGAASAVTVTVTRVRRGTLEDFRFFTLDERSRTATPYYVDATVRNDGPAGLGGSSLPLLAHSSADVVYPASELVGDFGPCPSSAVPERFLAGSTARLCFVYLVPKGETVRTIDLQPSRPSSAIRWNPSGSTGS